MPQPSSDPTPQNHSPQTAGISAPPSRKRRRRRKRGNGASAGVMGTPSLPPPQVGALGTIVSADGKVIPREEFIRDGAPGAPVNAIASARVLQEMALAAEANGLMAVAQDLMHKAQMADASGGRVGFDFPNLQSAFSGLPDMGSRITGAPLGMGTFDLDQPLMKAVAKESFKARPTPYKINEILYSLGAYDGIRDPNQATDKTFQILEKLARNPIVQMVINKRIFQVTRFARVSGGPRDKGFEIALKDSKAPMSRAARQVQEKIQNIILHGGLLELPNGDRNIHPDTGEPGVWDGAYEERAHTLRDALAIETRHSLTMDWSCSRIEHGSDPDKWPVVFYSPLDSSRVKLVEPLLYTQPRLDPLLNQVRAAEVSPYNEREVLREFSWETISTMVRNPRTDPLGRGYGLSEIEVFMEIIAAETLSLKFQTDHYDNAKLPYGLLFFKGMPALAGERYMQMLQQQMMRSGGAGNWWDVTCMMFPMGPNGQSGEAQFLPLRQQAQGEMQFVQTFQSSLVARLTGAFQMDPSEIGFQSVSTQTQTLNGADPASALQYSQESGLYPLLEAHLARRQRDIVERYDADFEMRWVGLDPTNEAAKEELAQKWFLRGYTPNKIAARLDEPVLRIAVDSELYNSEAEKFVEAEFDTHDEYQDKVNKAYEKAAKQKGMVKIWSAAPDLPAGNPSMLQVVQMEQQANDQAIQQAQAQAQGIDPQTGQPMGGDPNAQGDPSQMQGQPAIDPQTGQPMPGGGPMDPSQMQQMPPDVQQMPAPMQQDGSTPEPGADAGAPDENADLQPYHYLSDRQPDMAPSNGDDESDDTESDDDKRARYKRAAVQQLVQQLQPQSPIAKAVRDLLVE